MGRFGTRACIPALTSSITETSNSSNTISSSAQAPIPARSSFDLTVSRAATVDSQGDLVLRTNGSEVIQRRPIVYQRAGDSRKEIDGSYRLLASNLVAFDSRFVRSQRDVGDRSDFELLDILRRRQRRRRRSRRDSRFIRELVYRGFYDVEQLSDGLSGSAQFGESGSEPHRCFRLRNSTRQAQL